MITIQSLTSFPLIKKCSAKSTTGVDWQRLKLSTKLTLKVEDSACKRRWITSRHCS